MICYILYYKMFKSLNLIILIIFMISILFFKCNIKKNDLANLKSF